MSNDAQEKQQEIQGGKEEMKSDGNASQNQLLNDIEMAIKDSFKSCADNKAQTNTKLKLVPEILLQNNNFKDYYKPKEMSIGPVYAKSEALFKRELKVKLAAEFISKHDGRKEILFDAIKTNIDDLIKHFSEKMPKDELIDLLFLDGCSMLQFMISYVTGQLREFNISNGQAALIKQDLFLLENQIPFQVLTLLLYKFKDPISILHLIFSFVMKSNILALDIYLSTQSVDALLVQNKPVHLLDLLRKMIIFRNGETRASSKESSQTRSFRNVSELKLAGIKLKPNESYNLEIAFATHFFIIGHLKLPKLIVDDTTISKLLNLVAYEMSLDDYDTNCEVTSYVNFLDLLIDNEQDVKELRAAHVICNRLSSDIEVAQILNAIGSNCLAPPKDTYLKVKNEIQKHYERKSAIWMAQVYHDHFKSPWTVLALFAAVAILFLTGTQTWFAINPKK